MITKPPTCCDRWRGKPISSRGEIERQAQGAVGRVEPGLAHPLVGNRLVRSSPRRCRRARRRHRPDSPKHLADLADRAARAVADHGGGETGAVAAVFLVDVLDHLLAPLVLEIDIDVGRLVARGADEALEQDVDAGRVDRGDAEAVADDRIGRRAAPLAQDAAAAREPRRCRARSGNSARNRAARSAPARARSGSRMCSGMPDKSCAGSAPCVLRDAPACARPLLRMRNVFDAMHRYLLILRRPRSGRLEGRTVRAACHRRELRETLGGACPGQLRRGAAAASCPSGTGSSGIRSAARRG